MEERKTIHNTEGCARCGACCIFYKIEGGCGHGIFKESGVVCEFLEYDKGTGKAGCRIHDETRPPECEDYLCDKINERTREGLKRVAGNIEAYLQRCLHC